MARDASPFLEHAQKRCAAVDVRLVLLSRQWTTAGDSGEFDDKRRRLVVCVNDGNWLTTLAHELGHLEQWASGSALFKSDDKSDEDFDAWLHGKRIMSTRTLQRITRKIQRCELDAERRAVRYIRQFDLRDDVPSYIRAANFYVWQYEAARRLGRWVEATDARVAHMPDRLMRVADIGKPPADFGVGG